MGKEGGLRGGGNGHGTRRIAFLAGLVVGTAFGLAIAIFAHLLASQARSGLTISIGGLDLSVHGDFHEDVIWILIGIVTGAAFALVTAWRARRAEQDGGADYAIIRRFFAAVDRAVGEKEEEPKVKSPRAS